MKSDLLVSAALASVLCLAGCQGSPVSPATTPTLASTPVNGVPGPDGKWLVSDRNDQKFDAFWEVKGDTIQCTRLDSDGAQEIRRIQPAGERFIIRGGGSEASLALITPYEAVAGPDLAGKPALYAHRVSESPGSILGEWQMLDGTRVSVNKGELRQREGMDPTPYYYLPGDGPTFMLFLIPTKELVLGRVQEDGSLLLQEKPASYGFCLFRPGKRPAWSGTARVDRYQPLIQAGSGHKVENLAADAGPYKDYCRRVETGFSNASKDMCKMNVQMILDFKKGKYAGKPEELQAAITDYSERLMESLEQFDSKPVPQSLESSHKKVAKAHALCYASVLALKEAEELNGQEQASRLKEAERLSAEATRMVEVGLKEFRQVTQK